MDALMKRSIDQEHPGNLAREAFARGDYAEALRWSRENLRRNPADLYSQCAAAMAEYNLGRSEEALASARLAIDRGGPMLALSHLGAGWAARDIDRYSEAERHFAEAVRLDPDAHLPRAELASERLRRMEYTAENFRDLVGKYRRSVRPPLPQWDGSRVDGPLIVYNDVAIGDSIRSARFMPALRERCGELVYLAVRPMHWLASAPGIDRTEMDGLRLPRDAPNIGLYRALTFVDPRPETLWRGPYLSADPAKTAVWRERLSHLPRPWIGLCWAGGHEHANPDRLRCRDIPLPMLRPLLAVTATFVALQVPPPAGDRALMTEIGIMDVAASLPDLADTAALISALDLTITVDTAVAHIAGAIGAPVWILLPKPADWQWGTVDVPPWYPHAHLFRQPRPGDWRPVVDACVRRAVGSDLA